MSISYKKLWQEEKERAERLQAELDAAYSFIVANRSNLAETRPIVDLAGISRHMKVSRWTPQQWKQRDLLPPVDFPEIKEPLWYAETIRRKFAAATGRVWYENPDGDELSPAA